MTTHLGLQRILLPTAQVSSLTTGSITLPSARGQFADGDYFLIQKQVMSADATSVTFSNIPQTYTNLHLFTTLWSSASGTAKNTTIYFNSDTTGTNYQRHYLQNSAANGFQAGGNASTKFNFVYAAGTDYTDIYSTSHITIYDYASTVKRKSLYAISQYNNNGRGAGIGAGFGGIYSGLWKSNSAITSITFEDTDNSANLKSGSTLWLYGMKG